MTDRERNMMIAEKIFGWVRGPRWGNGNGGWTIDGKSYNEHHISWNNTPRYSTDISAAMQVVEKMRERNYLVGIGNSFGDPQGQWEVVFFAEGVTPDRADNISLPRAICEAALAAISQTKETV